MARYFTGETFQQSFRPSGRVEEGKLYFRGKKKLIGTKEKFISSPMVFLFDVVQMNSGQHLN